MRYLSLLLVCGLYLTSCGNADSAATEKAAMEAAYSAQQTAYDAMMEGHDRVMPMMGNITAAQKSIQSALEAEGLDAGKADLLEAAFEQLEDANDGMMEWMSGLKSLDDLRANMDNDAIITYITEEAADIAKVEMSMLAASGSANELVGSHDHGDGADHDHDGHDH
jgi:CheY-like chemotaxis protein